MGLREENIEKRRRRILAAARAIIAAGGPDELSMRALGKRAGVSVTTLYNLFGNKDDILVALIEDAVATVRPTLELAGASNPASALERLIESPVHYLAANESVFRAIITVGLYKDAGRAPHMQVLYGGIIGGIERIVAVAQESGFLSGDVPARLIAGEIFYSFRTAVEDWGCGLIDAEALSRRVRIGVHLILMAVVAEKGRRVMLEKIKKVESQALLDIGKLFPGLGRGQLPRNAKSYRQGRDRP